MRLRKIRLSGFKSFVDPTAIEFPGSVVGVVGPNGGGKSNIIDAVRWVMGEISARSLRGDTMADVVFNGSSTRKPVSRASVELIFDNLDGRIGGRFAAYNEIAVRRQLSREGQSTYWLNGARCRRRDVMDVFHGTGVGPRSYSIIEQGMISRIIEAKPEDLRDFLEEAAGISKYKERRRETENRMRHTADNLDRLNDLRDELARRLAHLERQAAQAEKYRTLEARRLELEAEHLALQWRTLDAEADRHARQIADQQTRLDAALAEQRRIEAELERGRSAHTEATDAYNRRYREVLDAGAEVARIEESMRSTRRRRDELAETMRHEKERLEAAKLQIERAREQRAEYIAQLEHDDPALDRLRDRASGAQRELREVEEAVQALQEEFDALSERERGPTRAMHAEQARVQHLESSIVELETRRRARLAERDTIDIGASASDLDPMRHRVEAMERELQSIEAERSRAERTVRELRDSVQAATAAHHEARERLGQCRGRAASLEALQHDALHPGSAAVLDLLEARGLADAPRLAQEMRVAPGWESAVEAVLGARLQAVSADAFESLVGDAATLEQGTIVAIDARAASEPAAGAGAHGLTPLRRKVETQWPIAALLDGVLCAESLEQGLEVRARLGPGESVITGQGVWLGRTWMEVRRGGAGEHGVLERARVIEAIGREMERLGDDEAAREREVRGLSDELRLAEETHATAQRDLNEGHRRAATMRSELAARTAETDQAIRRSAELDAEIADTATRLEVEQERLATAREQVERASSELSRLSEERARCEERRRAQREEFDRARRQWQSTYDEVHALELRVEAARSRLHASDEAAVEDRRRVEELEERGRVLGASLAETAAPLAQARDSLEEKLVQRASLEKLMGEARTEVEAAEEHVRRTDESRQRQTMEVHRERDALERLRVDSQATLVLRKTVEDRLESLGQALDALLARVGPDATPDEWIRKLEAMERRIARLGAINLAAIEEHERQAERKRYLDSQHADLEEALATLNAAIQKIDRETRTRFRETYERVDEHLGRTFPRLFAGGSARLQLTSDDILGAGVTVMAHPPGKRITSINLLSGGEKALTAIALIFAIFELNPAPFCLLDEVDAPLDDTNIGRFCELVKEMSNRVQLVIVTHNKITMETAGHLVGITMNEPGVSRLVAVDVEEAVQMAQA